MIQFREYAHGSATYDDAVALRLKVLRGPLGLALDPDDLAKEASEFHLGAFEEDTLIATLTLTPHGEEVKMRQVAVKPDRQGQGIGGGLVAFSEKFSRDAGFKKMVLHARETAAPFYERLGYETVGGAFIEVTIPHRAMWKEL